MHLMPLDWDYNTPALPLTLTLHTMPFRCQLVKQVMRLAIPDGSGVCMGFSTSVSFIILLFLFSPTGYWTGQGSPVTVVARLGHGSTGAPYNTTLLAQSYQNPPVYCSNVLYHTYRGHRFDCASAVVMMLHSLHHPTYLLNILLPTRLPGSSRRTNINLGHVKAVYVTFFSVSARYMQVLVGLQCVFFPVVATLLWHFRQGVKRLPRNPTHLECCLALLAVSLTLRNCPVEVVALIVDCPWLVVINDLRRNFFYAAFMIFFIYLTDKYARGVWCERSTQTLNLIVACGSAVVAAVEVTAHVGSLLHPLAPSHPPIHLALSLLMLVMVAAFLVALTLRTCAALESVCVRKAVGGDSTCQAGTVLLLTWLTTFITAAEFVLNRVQEGVWMWGGLLGEVEVENTGGFLLGVYSLWNTFTATLLILHTPLPRTPTQTPGCSETNRVVGVPLQCRDSPSFLDLTVTTL
ncbi:hypothetical protein Pmani_015921 [Petrolisthes manimaculis]|uniref:Protein wntless n=1 Tax=Petrolisthes manimaculis TaxID=1843537 RepID=A0AAE1PRD4_9EUCA|nr:hypothetical protein Pmani_015921 [Petrolisthes manimaculis]